MLRRYVLFLLQIFVNLRDLVSNLPLGALSSALHRVRVNSHAVHLRLRTAGRLRRSRRSSLNAERHQIGQSVNRSIGPVQFGLPTSTPQFPVASPKCEACSQPSH